MLGTKLLHRLSRGVTLTPAGEALRRHAHTILTALDQLTTELSEFAEGARGSVRILANRSAVSEFLPEDLRSFLARYPTIDVNLEEENSAAIIESVADGDCDIGIFTGGIVDSGSLQTFDYRTGRFVLLVSSDHPLADLSSVAFAQTVSYPFIQKLGNALSMLELPNLQRLGCIGRSARGSRSKNSVLIGVWHNNHAFLIRDDYIEWRYIDAAAGDCFV